MAWRGEIRSAIRRSCAFRSFFEAGIARPAIERRASPTEFRRRTAAHRPVENRVFGEQLGPGRSSRALAIVHIAIFDAVNGIVGDYRSYTGIRAAPDGVSMNAAVCQAAHDALTALFPSQVASFDQVLAEDLGRIPDRSAKANGINLGRRAAGAILALRADDGSQHAEPRLGIDHTTSDLPGRWRQDPISLIPLALAAHWGETKTFVLGSASQFRVPPPPALDSLEYAMAFDEVKRLGGDGVVTPTEPFTFSDEQGRKVYPEPHSR